MLSVITGTCVPDFPITNKVAAFIDFAALVSAFVAGVLMMNNVNLGGFTLPPTAQWMLAGGSLLGILLIANKKITLAETYAQS